MAIAAKRFPMKVAFLASACRTSSVNIMAAPRNPPSKRTKRSSTPNPNPLLCRRFSSLQAWEWELQRLLHVPKPLLEAREHLAPRSAPGVHRRKTAFTLPLLRLPAEVGCDDQVKHGITGGGNTRCQGRSGCSARAACGPAAARQLGGSLQSPGPP